MEIDMYTKNPYGVPYDEMIEGAIFYDMWRKQWVVLDKPYDASRQSYWFVKNDDAVDDVRILSHLDDLAYNKGDEDD